MAALTVKQKCLKCSKDVEGDCVYVTSAETSRENYRRKYRTREIPEDRVKILYRTKQPKGVLHRACWEEMIGGCQCASQ